MDKHWYSYPHIFRINTHSHSFIYTAHHTGEENLISVATQWLRRPTVILYTWGLLAQSFDSSQVVLARCKGRGEVLWPLNSSPPPPPQVPTPLPRSCRVALLFTFIKPRPTLSPHTWRWQPGWSRNLVSIMLMCITVDFRSHTSYSIHSYPHARLDFCTQTQIYSSYWHSSSLAFHIHTSAGPDMCQYSRMRCEYLQENIRIFAHANTNIYPALMHTLIHKYNIHCAHGRMLVTFRLLRVSLSERTQLFSGSVTARFCQHIFRSH